MNNDLYESLGEDRRIVWQCYLEYIRRPTFDHKIANFYITVHYKLGLQRNEMLLLGEA